MGLVDDVVARLWPMIEATINRAIDGAQRRASTPPVMPGKVVNVTAGLLEVVLDDAESDEDLSYCTRTHADQVRGSRVLVVFYDASGGAYALGPIPQA